MNARKGFTLIELLVVILILAILVLHWVQTRTEPEFLKPFIDTIAPFFPDVPGSNPVPPHRR